jgi:uncharacterized protein
MQDELAVVDSLTYNVSQLLRDTVGAYRNVQASVALGELAPELEGSGDAVLSGPVRLMHTNTGILVQGRLRAQMQVDCARCLEPVAVPLEVSVEEVFSPTIDILTGKSITPEEEDRALWIDEHHILDLSEVVRQDVLLAAPISVMCRTDCRGLCPNCGQDLNQGKCGCEPEPDPRWGPLLELLDQ